MILDQVLLTQITDTHGIFRLNNSEAEVLLNKLWIFLVLFEMGHVRLITLKLVVIKRSLFIHELSIVGVIRISAILEPAARRVIFT
jgi:hypothetical protein